MKFVHRSSKGIAPNPDVRNLVIGLHELECLVPQPFHPSLYPPCGMGVLHRPSLDRIIGQLLTLYWAAPLQGSQDSVDEGSRRTPTQTNCFMHRSIGWNPVQIKELVGSQPKEVPDIQVHRLERTIQDSGEDEVNRPAMTQDSVAKLRR